VDDVYEQDSGGLASEHAGLLVQRETVSITDEGTESEDLSCLDSSPDRV
jgi:hypothetical protein